MAFSSDIDAVANILGINNWDIQQATYNGVVFHVSENTALSQFQDYDPLAGPVQTAINVFQNQNAGDVFGTNTTNNKNLPYGTKSVVSDFKDVANRKLVKHSVPNMQGDIFEDLGFAGETFVGTGVVFGTAYYSALFNFETYFINDKAVSEADRHVLNHPIRGKITDTYLVDYEIQHVSKRAKACIFTFRFASEKVGTTRADSNSISNMINRGLAGAQGIAGGLSQLGQDINTIGGLL